MHHIQTLDIVIIGLYFLIVFSIAAYYTRRAGKDTGEFFLSGRNLPWYIAGTAMVATTFAADTPLAVTELVAKNGIAGNWLWWNMAIGATLTVFFFAKLWRRAEIMTDVEFVELRYSGKAAAALRGFRALYLGLLMNAIVMGWVHKAMQIIFHVTFPEINSFLLVIIAAFIIAIYSSASGLLGTARTDSFQFVFAMAGCIVLAIIVLNLPEIGGVVSLKEKLAPQVTDFLPRIGEFSAGGVTAGVLAIPIGAFAITALFCSSLFLSMLSKFLFFSSVLLRSVILRLTPKIELGSPFSSRRISKLTSVQTVEPSLQGCSNS